MKRCLRQRARENRWEDGGKAVSRPSRRLRAAGLRGTGHWAYGPSFEKKGDKVLALETSTFGARPPWTLREAQPAAGPQAASRVYIVAQEGVSLGNGGRDFRAPLSPTTSLTADQCPFSSPRAPAPPGTGCSRARRTLRIPTERSARGCPTAPLWPPILSLPLWPRCLGCRGRVAMWPD